MATSSITANFYTDDPKAANAIVRALFTVSAPTRRFYIACKRTRLFSILLAALAEALHERLHAATDRLAAEAKQRKSGQLEI